MEIAISSWRDSFFGDLPVSLATVRAGNVIGGGDWTKNRIVPDIVRALQSSTEVGIRNPNSVRPFQHVLEPLSGYLRLAERMHSGERPVSNAYNFGPAPEDAVTVAELVETALTHWPGRWVHQSVKDAPHEAGLLKPRPQTSHAPNSATGHVGTAQEGIAAHDNLVSPSTRRRRRAGDDKRTD